MRRVLDRLGIDGDAYRCLACDAELGPAGESWKDLAVHFDDEMSAAEPTEVAGGGMEFVLRHHCCPACGVLFEAEPVLTRPAGAP
jgi:hypothetical protein